MSEGHYNVLFLSHRNTARSIFAEAVLNKIGGGNFRGFSAGTHPADELDPLVRDILLATQYPTAGLHPKHWNEFIQADAPPLDFVLPCLTRLPVSPCPTGPADRSLPTGTTLIRYNYVARPGSDDDSWSRCLRALSDG